MNSIFNKLIDVIMGRGNRQQNYQKININISWDDFIRKFERRKEYSEEPMNNNCASCLCLCGCVGV